MSEQETSETHLVYTEQIETEWDYRFCFADNERFRIKMKQAFQFNLIYILIDSIRCAKCHHKLGAYSIEELK